MVVNALLSMFADALSWLLSLMPHLSVPTWLTTAGTTLTGLLNGLSGTSGWLPWIPLEASIGLALAAVGISVAIRGVRIVASFLTLGGGS
jgi:hypothetical protein